MTIRSIWDQITNSLVFNKSHEFHLVAFSTAFMYSSLRMNQLCSSHGIVLLFSSTDWDKICRVNTRYMIYLIPNYNYE